MCVCVCVCVCVLMLTEIQYVCVCVSENIWLTAKQDKGFIGTQFDSV